MTLVSAVIAAKHAATVCAAALQSGRSYGHLQFQCRVQMAASAAVAGDAGICGPVRLKCMHLARQPVWQVHPVDFT